MCVRVCVTKETKGFASKPCMCASHMQAAADRLRELPGLRLGPLRDVTINYRHSGFLRLDPHLDPGA